MYCSHIPLKGYKQPTRTIFYAIYHHFLRWDPRDRWIIDDLKSIDPWDPRGIRIYGNADVVSRQGGYMEGTGHANPIYIRISPKKK